MNDLNKIRHADNAVLIADSEHKLQRHGQALVRGLKSENHQELNYGELLMLMKILN